MRSEKDGKYEEPTDENPEREKVKRERETEREGERRERRVTTMVSVLSRAASRVHT